MAKALSRKVTIYINGKEVQSTLQSLEGEMRKLQAEQKKMVIGSEEYIKTSMKIREINAVINEQKNAVKGMGNEWKSTTQRVAEFANIVTGLNSAFQMIDLGVGKLKDLAKDAAALDDIYADVMKTTGMTHDQVESLNEAFKKMDTRTSREQLNQLAYEAGKLGINSQEAVEGFVSAADKINIALGDVLGEGAMVTIGKLSGVYEKSTKQLADASGDIESQMLKIGSAINMLGQSSTANENYLVDFMGRLGGIATQAGLSADQILGYASALDQDMQKVEMSATAFQKLIQQMIKKPEEFVQAAKMPLQEFQKLMESDMNSAIKKVLQGFNEMGGLNQLIPVFKDMGLDGARAASVVAAMASSLDKVAEAQTIANQELNTGNSVLNEFNTKNETMQAQAEKAKKQFEEMRIELGNELYPILIHLQRTGTVLMKGVAGFAQVIKENKAVLPGLIALMANWVRVKTMAFIASGKLQSAVKAMLGVSKLEARQMAVNTANEAKLTAAKEAERLTSLQNQLAIEKENLARQKSKVGMEAQSLVTVAETRVKQLEVAVTEQAAVAEAAHAKAINASKAAFASTPWGLIITALTTIAAVTVGIVKNSEKWKLNQTLKETARQAGKAEGQVKVLFDRLKDASEGSEQYKAALNELKAAYPDLIAKHIDEEGKLKDLTAAYNDLAAAARQSAYDRMYAEKVSEKQGELSNSLEKKIQDFNKKIDRNFRDLSEAERQLMKQQMNTLLREAAEGNKKMADILISANDIIKKNGGNINATFANVMKNDLMKMRGEAQLAAKALNDLKTIMSANERDPYGVQKMSLKELETEYKKVNDAIDQGYVPSLAEAEKKLKAIHAQIQKLKAEQKENQSSTGGGGYTSGEDPKEAAERAKRAVKEWENATKEGQKIIDQFTLKAESGIQKLEDEIDQKTEAIIGRLKEAAKAAGKDAGPMIKEIEDAAEKLKSQKLDVYITKLKDAYWKLAESMGDTDAAGRLMAESDKLQDAIANIDKAIEQAEADAKVATGEHQKELQRLISYYRELKAEIGGELYRRIQEVQSSFEVVEKQVWDPDKEEWVVVPTIKVDKAKMEKQTKDAVEGIKKLIEGIEIEPTAFQKWCNKNLDIVEDFADKALSIFSNINTILNNISDQRIKDLEDEKDANIKTLDEQLEQGLISQETYDQKKQDIENEYNEKANEEKKKQWQRDKAFSLSEANIAAALAAVKVWAAEGTTAYKVAMSALLAAELATQIAAIASQPEPRAKGGYVDRDTVFRAGEAGREWIASNRLLNDPVAGPTIEALESYQRGNRRALGDIPMARLNMPVAMSAARELGSRTTGSSTGRITASKGDDMLSVMKQLAAYLEDPKNRQAIISRQTMMDFDSNEQFLRNRASI